MLFAEWRLVCSGPADCYVNMAIDEATLTLAGEGRVPPTVRIYSWDAPCQTIGYLQGFAGPDKYLAGARWKCVRRLTGGQSCLHGGDLAYSVIVSLDDTLIPSNVLDSYRRVSAGVIEGLRLLGVDARCAPPAGIEANGQVIATAAQARRQGVLLHQGSVALVSCGAAEHLQIDHRPLTPLADVVGSEINHEAAVEALSMGFRRALGVDLSPSVLYAKEKRLARQLLRDRYMRPEWTLAGGRIMQTTESPR